jgi:hypothetical protein
MKTSFKIAMISAALAVVTVPALAQAQDFHNGRHNDRGPMQHTIVREGFDLFQRIDQLENRIDRGRMNGSISRSEARHANSEVASIRRDLTRATAGRARLTPMSHARFDQRIDRLGFFVQSASNNHNGRPHFRG